MWTCVIKRVQQFNNKHFKTGAGKMLEPSSSEEEDEDYLQQQNSYGQTHLEPPGVRQNYLLTSLTIVHCNEQSALSIPILGAPEWGASKGFVPWKYVCRWG